jgi:hypothetical protein
MGLRSRSERLEFYFVKLSRWLWNAVNEVEVLPREGSLTGRYRISLLGKSDRSADASGASHRLRLLPSKASKGRKPSGDRRDKARAVTFTRFSL